MNILICDDDKNTVASLERLLIDEGHSVITASNKQGVVKKFKDNIIDLVFLDILMPGEGGFEILQDLRKIKSGIAVVLMTGLLVKWEEPEKAGVFDYLYKPFDLDRPKSIIEKAKHSKS